MSQKLTVLVVDDERDRITQLAVVWKSIVGLVQLEPEVMAVCTLTEAQAALARRPHVVVVDNVFREGDRDIDNKGLRFIAEHKASHSDCVFVLSTGANFSINSLGSVHPNPDLIAPKSALTSNNFQRYFASEIAKEISRVPIAEIIFEEADVRAELDAVHSKVASVLGQCLRALKAEYDFSPVQRVGLRKLAGGYSGSLVFKAEAVGLGGGRTLPFVFKISGSDAVAHEATMFNQFARLQMPHDMRVDLIGTGVAGDVRGALYAFAFGDPGAMSTASARLQGGDVSVIDLVLRKIVTASRIGWYRRPAQVGDVESFYNNSQEYGIEKDGRRVEGLGRLATDVFSGVTVQINEQNYRINNSETEHVRRYLRKFSGRTVAQVLCHGDLNLNNVILGPSPESIALIDFEYSGFNALYKDCISLELSFRLSYTGFAPTGRANAQRLVRAEKAICQNRPLNRLLVDLPGVDVYEREISRIRMAAQQICRDIGQPFEIDIYCLGLAFHGLKLCAVGSWDLAAATKLVSCVIAMTEILKDMD
jgi:hypothetical protein